MSDPFSLEFEKISSSKFSIMKTIDLILLILIIGVIVIIVNLINNNKAKNRFPKKRGKH